ncbi:MAG: 4Fe-4S ferredoxin [Spirochaetes bacterium]|nr:MAG: 4Fe-4S ferredoxin [Spirochaetota bacterium]
MLDKDGVPTKEELLKQLPSEERLDRGPVVVIECFQEIPCDPCYYSCRRRAIREFADINSIPIVDFERCNGCTLCISSCPGLAIFVVDKTYSEESALVIMPYELLPLPEEGEEVACLDRRGEEVCKGRVVNIRTRKMQDKTAVISVAVPKEMVMEVRNIRVTS